MVSKCIVSLLDVHRMQKERKELEDRLESDAKKDGLIRKLKQDIESEIKTRQGMQAVGDGANRGIQHRLVDTREELKRALDRIKELESKAQARRSRRAERLMGRDRVNSVFGGGSSWGSASGASGAPGAASASGGRSLPQLDPTDV